VEQRPMKYKQLKAFLDGLEENDPRLETNVTIYEASTDKFYSMVELYETYEETGDVPKNQLYFAFE
jgi:predicted AAA+ superfamily ATPase